MQYNITSYKTLYYFILHNNFIVYTIYYNIICNILVILCNIDLLLYMTLSFSLATLVFFCKSRGHIISVTYGSDCHGPSHKS